MSDKRRQKEAKAGGVTKDGARRLSRRALLGIGAAVAALVLAIAGYVAASGQLGGGSDEPSGPLTAAIVDQLSLTAPNPEFVRHATETLEKAGYRVDYYPGEQVTVDFYRSLPTLHHDLVILRGHSARLQEEWEGTTIDEVILFTNEPYDEKKYVNEQELGRLSIARYHKDSDKLFGIAPGFIEHSMEGNFNGATVILMGCEGLGSEATADAFVSMGAESIISWTGLVSATHTDRATEELLRLLVAEDQSPDKAVAGTMAEVGPDPTYDSELRVLSQ
jgi:hypothetical protein